MLVKCPEKLITVFLAGGISNCPDWQAEALSMLAVTLPDSAKVAIYNPRRDDFDINDPNMSTAQIAWEFEALEKADAVLFWFPHQTLCPITLYELGSQARSGKKLFVGTHEDYARKLDVQVQLKHLRPDVQVRTSLNLVLSDLLKWLGESNVV